MGIELVINSLELFDVVNLVRRRVLLFLLIPADGVHKSRHLGFSVRGHTNDGILNALSVIWIFDTKRGTRDLFNRRVLCTQLFLDLIRGDDFDVVVIAFNVDVFVAVSVQIDVVVVAFFVCNNVRFILIGERCVFGLFVLDLFGRRPSFPLRVPHPLWRVPRSKPLPHP